MDPGSDHEVTKTLTLPKNVENGVYDNGHSYVIFDDEECTTVSHWDRMSDHTWYIFTDPSSDLVDKYTELGMALRREQENAE